MEVLGFNNNTLTLILREKLFEIASNVMSYHDYKNIWKPTDERKLENTDVVRQYNWQVCSGIG